MKEVFTFKGFYLTERMNWDNTENKTKFELSNSDEVRRKNRPTLNKQWVQRVCFLIRFGCTVDSSNNKNTDEG